MSKYFIILTIAFFVIACSKNKNVKDPEDYKQAMREFVIGISNYAKSKNEHFNIIPQNGIELITKNGDISGDLDLAYLNAIDGNGQEDLFYGYTKDDKATPSVDNTYLTSFLNLAKDADKTILVTDYCSTPSKVSDSYTKNNLAGFISFAADERDLTSIPTFPLPIHQENNNIITQLKQAKNFLYLINPSNFDSKLDFINAVTSTNYDILIMDLFLVDNISFTASEINQLKNKANGGKRLVICYMSIGEAEDYRYYWKSNWNKQAPNWLDKENPNWEGNYKVKYWYPEWQQIIFGNSDSYLQKIIDADFDGVYLDIIDAFEYYES